MTFSRRRPRRSWLVQASIVMLAATSLWFGVGIGASRAIAADPSADVPGIPLPGPVAAGRLGGAIYDVVYNVPVPAGYVIIASLTGTPGTDFDLYLFDTSATSVVSTTGLLTKSAGTTSTESISWPSRDGGVYYLDLNGSTNVEGDYRLTVQTVRDPTPPLVSMVLADGRSATNQSTVPVKLTATEDLSGVAEMAFSTDGVTYGPWTPFEPSTTWTFPPGDVEQTLWVKVKNGVGRDSAAVSAHVTIDTAAPTAIDFDPVPGSRAIGLRPRLAVRFSESIDAATWANLGLIVQSVSGALVGGAFDYDEASHTGGFVPGAALEAGSPYFLTLGDVTDVAGNRVTSVGSWVIIPVAATTISGPTGPKVITAGATARLDYELGGIPLPATLTLQGSTSQHDFTDVSVVSAMEGTLSIGVTPDRNTTYRLVYPGNDSIAPAQRDIRVLVRRSVVLVGRSSTVPARGSAGTSVKLVASISPATAGVSISFRGYRFDAARHTWVYAGSRGRSTDRSGRATMTWTPTSPGSFYWRAVVGSTADFTNNVSPVYQWRILR